MGARKKNLSFTELLHTSHWPKQVTLPTLMSKGWETCHVGVYSVERGSECVKQFMHLCHLMNVASGTDLRGCIIIHCGGRNHQKAEWPRLQKDSWQDAQCKILQVKASWFLISRYGLTFINVACSHGYSVLSNFTFRAGAGNPSWVGMSAGNSAEMDFWGFLASVSLVFLCACRCAPSPQGFT